MVAITSSSPNESCDDKNIQNDYERSNIGRRPSRKQWNLHGEPRNLLKRLRSQLAEDGCSESQLLMGKTLLEQKFEENYDENCEQAVFYLTQSSLQGCLEATNLLKECLESGAGISEQNYLDVKKCIEMDQEEKLALVAAKQLFKSVSEGNDFITHRRLENKMAEILNPQLNQNEESGEPVTKNQMKMSLHEKFGSQRLSEDQLSATAVEIVNGDLPSIELHENAIFSKPKTIFFKFPSIPLHIAHNLHYLLSKKMNSYFYSEKILFASLICSVVLLSCSLQLRNVACFSLCILWVFSFFFMCYSVSHIIVRHNKKYVYDSWLVVLQHFSPSLNVNSGALKYKRKCIRYYSLYLIGVVLYLSFYPLIQSKLKAFVIPPFFMLSCFLSLSLFRTHFLYNIISSTFYVAAHHPLCQLYLKNWLINTMPSFSRYILDESFSIYGLITFKFNIGSVFHILWFVSLLFVSLNVSLYGIFHHIVCITWFHLGFLTWKESDGLFIYFAFVFWFLVFFLPKSYRYLSTIAPISVFALSSFINGCSHLFIFTSVIAIFIFLKVLKYFDSKLTTIFKLLLLIFSMTFLFQLNLEYATRVSGLKWEHYQSICFSNKESISLRNSVNCLSLRGSVVHWQAIAKNVEIESVSNGPETILNIFPEILQSKLRCFIGKPVPVCKKESFANENDYQHCLIIQIAKNNECSLEEWNRYKFRIEVSMESNFWKFSKSNDLILNAGSEFHDFVFNLSVNDKISFVGTLQDKYRLSPPEVNLLSIKCSECKMNNLSASIYPESEFNFNLLMESVRSTFDFILGPTFTLGSF